PWASATSAIAATSIELQATTSILTSRSVRYPAISSANVRISSSGRGPYGKRPLSPTYRIGSFGSRAKTARATVRPPTPESKMPIGRGSLIRPSVRLARSHGHHRHRRLPPQGLGEVLLGPRELGRPRRGGQVLPPTVGQQTHDVAAFELGRDAETDVEHRSGRDAGEDALAL